MRFTGDGKHWREFNIYILTVSEQDEYEEDEMERLGLPSRRQRKSNNEEAQITSLSLPLEDISDYYESYNSVKKVKGVAISTYPGANYFLAISYKEFKKMRYAAGLEIDPRPWYKRIF